MTDTGAGATEAPEGRYLYCIASPDRPTAVEMGAPLDAEGVADGDPYLVTDSGLAAVVQRRGDPYQSDDETTVRRWLLQHQGVVDTATERFGTPVPVRFGTILRGGDDGIAEWLRDRVTDLRPALDRFAGRSEYRIEVTCRSETFAADAIDSDDRLADLRAQQADAPDGTAFLKSKQATQRERTLVRDQWSETTAALRNTVADHAIEVTDLDRPTSTLAGSDRSSDADFATAFTVLADEAAADAIGDRLDRTAARPGVEVRYTGPWPPYTFAPALEGEQ